MLLETKYQQQYDNKYTHTLSLRFDCGRSSLDIRKTIVTFGRPFLTASAKSNSTHSL